MLCLRTLRVYPRLPLTDRILARAEHIHLLAARHHAEANHSLAALLYPALCSRTQRSTYRPQATTLQEFQASSLRSYHNCKADTPLREFYLHFLFLSI